MKKVLIKTKSVFKKIIFFFLLIILAAYIITFYIYSQGKNSVRSEVGNAFEKKVGVHINTMNSEIDRILSVQREYINNKALNRLAFQFNIMTPYEKIEAIGTVQSELYFLESVSKYIENVVLDIPTYPSLITSKDLIDKNIEDGENNLYHINSAISKTPVIHYKDKLYINLLNSNDTFSAKDDNNTFAIRVTLGTNQLINQLKEFASYESGGAILYTKNDNIYIPNDETSSVNKFLINQIKAAKTDKLVSKIKRFYFKGKSYIEVNKYSEVLGMTLMMYSLEDSGLGNQKSFNIQFYIMSFLFVVFIGIYLYIIYRFISKPLNALVAAFKKVEQGNLFVEISHDENDEFGYLYSKFNNMVIRIRELIEDGYEEKIHSQQAELKQLQYQINPHFLYNSLYIIRRMASVNDNETVIKLSNHLAQFCEFITRGSKNMVSLKTEINHVKNYIEIQNIRFSHRIKVVIDEIPTSFEKLLVPRLIVQPIVENSYKYALEPLEEEGCLVISFFKEEECLVIRIQDNGNISNEAAQLLQNQINVSDHLSDEISGIINVHRRLKIRFGKNSGVKVSVAEAGGMCVDLYINMEGAEFEY